MTARRAYPFEQTIAGTTTYGIAFDSEAERDEALRIVLDGAAPPIASLPAAPIEADEPRAPGRPPIEAPIGAAVEALGRQRDTRGSAPTSAAAHRDEDGGDSRQPHRRALSNRPGASKLAPEIAPKFQRW